MMSKWHGNNRRDLRSSVVALGLCMAGCDDPVVLGKESFYTYDGFRDWWRLPLEYPYQVSFIDEFESGALEKYDPAANPADGAGFRAVLDRRVVMISPAKSGVAFINDEFRFGFFSYGNEKTTLFASKSELDDFVRRNYPGEPSIIFHSLKHIFDITWFRLSQHPRTPPN